MNPTAALSVDGVSRAFGSVSAVNNVSFTLNGSSVVALLGPSGCGKTTLLHLIAGLLETDSGTISLGGNMVDSGGTSGQSTPAHLRRVGVVFQDFALFPHLNVADNVAFGINRLPRPQRHRRVDELLDLVRLGGFGQRFPHELSGGEQQRVALARALAPSPLLLLLDEPFANLDRSLREDLRVELAELLRATNVPSLLVTHDHVDALVVADRIIVMNNGQIVQDGDPVEVHDRPVDESVGRLFGPIARFGGRLVRPHDLQLSLHDPANADARTAKVKGSMFLGSVWRHRVETTDGECFDVDVSRSHARPAVGTVVWITRAE